MIQKSEFFILKLTYGNAGSGVVCVTEAVLDNIWNIVAFWAEPSRCRHLELSTRSQGLLVGSWQEVVL